MAKNPEKIEGVNKFLNELMHKMPELYRSYTWDGDPPDISHRKLFDLELEIRTAAKTSDIRIGHLRKIATWGGHPNPDIISSPECLNIPLYLGNEPAPCLFWEPVNAICVIEGRVHGFGPTFSSKLLHFAVPRIFGALDTRLVRVFGRDSEDPDKYQFLDLKVTRPKKGRPSIPGKQEHWPEEYGTWVAILNYMAKTLNQNQIECNHPESYVQEKLRNGVEWLPADVETALFSYASKVLNAE